MGRVGWWKKNGVVRLPKGRLVQACAGLSRIQCRSNEEYLEDLTCPICLHLFVAPMQCKDGHVFCKACIEKVLQSKEECPMDCRRLQVADLSRALVVENMMDKMRVLCPHAAQHTEGEDCGWVGKVSERQSHLDNECQYAEVPCLHDGCEVRVQRRVMIEHAVSCEQRVEECRRCGEGRVFARHAQHRLRCPMVPVVCKPGCEKSFLRQDIKAHEQVCPEVPVECVFKPSGCAVGTLLRKDVAAHERDAAGTHAALALQLQLQLQRGTTVSVRWRVEDVEAKMAAGDVVCSKKIMMRSATEPETPFGFNVEIEFDEGEEVGEINFYCAERVGVSLTLCKADSEEGIVLPSGFGWSVTYATLRESHVAADGSITILVTLCAAQLPRLKCLCDLGTSS